MMALSVRRATLSLLCTSCMQEGARDSWRAVILKLVGWRAISWGRGEVDEYRQCGEDGER